MDDHPYIDEQSQSLLIPGYKVPERKFSGKITRKLGIIQCLVGLLCLVLAVVLDEKSYDVNCSSYHSVACNCICTHSNGTGEDDSLGLLSRHGLKITPFSIVGAVMGCLVCV